MKIRNKRQHAAALKRVGRLMDYKVVKELDELSIAVSEYESRRWPIKRLTPREAVKVKMEELEINQGEMGELLGMRKSHFSEFMNGLICLPIESIRLAVAEQGMDAYVLLELE